MRNLVGNTSAADAEVIFGLNKLAKQISIQSEETKKLNDKVVRKVTFLDLNSPAKFKHAVKKSGSHVSPLKCKTDNEGIGRSAFGPAHK